MKQFAVFLFCLLPLIVFGGYGAGGYGVGTGAAVESPYDFGYKAPADAQTFLIATEKTAQVSSQYLLEIIEGPGVIYLWQICSAADEHVGSLNKADTTACFAQLYIEQDGQSVYILPDGTPTWVRLDDALCFSELSRPVETLMFSKAVTIRDSSCGDAARSYHTWVTRKVLSWEDSIKFSIKALDQNHRPYVWFDAELDFTDTYYSKWGRCRAVYMNEDFGCYDYGAAAEFITDTTNTGLAGSIAVTDYFWAIDGTKPSYGAAPAYTSGSQVWEVDNVICFDGGFKFTELAEPAQIGDTVIKVMDDITNWCFGGNAESPIIVRASDHAQVINGANYSSYGTVMGSPTDSSILFGLTYNSSLPGYERDSLRRVFPAGAQVAIFGYDSSQYESKDYVNIRGMERKERFCDYYSGFTSGPHYGPGMSVGSRCWIHDYVTVKDTVGFGGDGAEAQSFYRYVEPCWKVSTHNGDVRCFRNYLVHNKVSSPDYYVTHRMLTWVYLSGAAGVDYLTPEWAERAAEDSFYVTVGTSDAHIFYYGQGVTFETTVKNATGTCAAQTDAFYIGAAVRVYDNAAPWDSFSVYRGHVHIPIDGVDPARIDTAELFFTVQYETAAWKKSGDSLYFFLANFGDEACAAGDYDDTLAMAPIASYSLASLTAGVEYSVLIESWALDSLVRKDAASNYAIQLIVRTGGDYKWGSMNPENGWYDYISFYAEEDAENPVWVRICHREDM